MLPELIHRGMSLKASLRVARWLGCFVRNPRKTGEVLVSHPRIDRPVRINNRRRDISRRLLAFLKQVREGSESTHEDEKEDM
jgi:hypothetical protein